VAVTNARIIHADDQRVVVRCLDRQRQCWTTVTLTPEAFMRRFLQHALPAGFHKVRSCGFWAPANRQRLYQRQHQLEAATTPSADQKADPPAGQRPLYGCCPIGKTGHRMPIARIGAPGRGPPKKTGHDPYGQTSLNTQNRPIQGQKTPAAFMNNHPFRCKLYLDTNWLGQQIVDLLNGSLQNTFFQGLGFILTHDSGAFSRQTSRELRGLVAAT
jgi:hypothetical protein